MSIKSSGLWCDLCEKPILSDPWWHCAVNGKPGHSCNECKERYAVFKSKKIELPRGDGEEEDLAERKE